MTDSMKFGPEWLRNMATDMTNNQGSGGGGSGGGGSSSTSSSASSTNSNNNGSSNSYQFGQQQQLQQQQQQQLQQQQQQQQQQVSQLQVRGQFPEFRYGREEMLSLFNKNCSMPEILPSFKKLFVDKVQYPLALTPSTEEEVFPTVTQPPTQRPQWVQRSPVLFNTASRGNGRGGSVDRGRMRGKSIYHPIFPRPTPMFEDDARNLKSERGWSERNGGAGESSSVGVADWSISPSSSPRKDFSGHPARNLENWRRSRHDEDGVASSGPPGGGSANSGLSGGGVSGGGASGDGWRGSGTNNFGNNRWGRSTSWRDDDGGNGGGVESNAYNIPPMQRSYSTIATSDRTYFSVLSKSSSLTSATAGSVGSGGGNNDNSNKSNGPSNNSRHHHQNSANHQWDTEDILPEWAMENPTDSGGTFDATGAFHGSVDEDDEKRRGDGSGSSSTTSSTSSSNRKKPNDSTTQDENSHRSNRKMAPKGEEAKLPMEQDRVSLNDEDSESNEIEQRNFKDDNLLSNNTADNLIHSGEENSSNNKLETSEEHLSDTSPINNSSSPSQLTTQITSTPNSANTSAAVMQSSHKMPLTELSDRMQEVADDMVEKLIMDDDNVAQNSQKPSAATAPNSVPPSSTVATGKLQTNVSILPPAVVGSNAAKVAAMYKTQALANKPMFLQVVDPIMQQHQMQQQAAAAAAAAAAMGSGPPPPGSRMLPPPITKPSNELWFYRDPQSKVQGPFTANEMIEWYRAGYFDENLYVRRMCDNRFAALGDLIKMCGQMPFQSSHLIPPLQSTEVPSMTNPIPIMPMTPHDSGHKVKDSPGVGIVNGPNIDASDLKGCVTATADALSAAVKNMMNPVDMSHMLNAHFQMLQDQYIQHQEMAVIAEFSTKDTFNRLTPSEKANVVRQKVHMLGLPEHLTSLTGLSNSLASLNPAAGNQLYDIISECSKKDSYGMSPLEAQLQQFQQQHLHHQQQQQQQQQVQQQQVQHQQVQQQQVQQVQQQSQNAYLEPDDYLQQQQQQQQQQHQQVNQQSGMYQGVPYRSAYPQMDRTIGIVPGEEQLNADILNEINLRMMLFQGRLRSGREQAPIPPPLGAAPNDFGAELLARAAPQVLAAAVVNMMPQWPPHMLPHGQIPQQPQQQQQPPPQQTTQPPHVAPNQWPIIAGPVAVPQLPAPVGKPPVPMWATADPNAQLIMQQQQQPPPQQQQQQQQVEVMHPKVDNSFVSVQLQPPSQPLQQPQQQQHRYQDNNSNNIGKTKDELTVEENANAINNNISVLTTSNTIAPPGVAVSHTTYASSNNNKNKIDKLKSNEDNQNSVHITNKQQTNVSSVNSNNANASNISINTNAINNANINNKRNVKQKSNEKPIDTSKNKPQQQQAQTIAGPTEEERRKEAAEEKRKQKEEKKRQQQEEEKKRQQLAEEEKRRQASEEKERQKEIHAHRRKAMLSSNTGGSTANLSSNTNIAANGKPTISGPGSTMSKQERMQTSIAPWSTNIHAIIASTPGPSLAEIQKAERRERRADQQRLMEIMEKQMRIAAAAEATDNVLKWNAAPVPVKSLAEIQAEEAKRLASEQAANAELQRRKEQEQATSAAANSLSSSNPFAMIWSGSKVWGTTNSTSAFWEESAKSSNAAAAISSSAPTAAVVVTKAVGHTSATGGSINNITSKQSASTSSTSGGNITAAGASAGGNRSLSKSQTVSGMVGSSNWTSVNMSNNSSQSKSQHQNSSIKQQQGSNSNENNANKGKKGNKNITGSSSATNCTSSNSVATTNVSNNHVNKNDDYRNEFTGWCMKSLNNMNPKVVDVPTFVTFLQDLESPYEVKDYIRMYLGESKEYTEFAKQFLERRSKYKNLQRAQNAHIDDMCKPAPAINPSGNDSFDNKGKQKKVKKSKMTKLDARILGFSVTAAEGRINVGDRDYGDAS